LTQDKVAVVFGCWTSVSRKSVLPVFEELNGLLFYPVQYEGEEMSRNVFYTGAAPNQQAIPAVEYLMSKEVVAPNVSTSSELTMSTRVRQTRFFARFSTPKGFRMPISLKLYTLRAQRLSEHR
jgi:hypothetical protein